MKGVDDAADASVSWVVDGENLGMRLCCIISNQAIALPMPRIPSPYIAPFHQLYSLSDYVTLRARTKLNRLTAGKDRLVLCMRSLLCTLTHPKRRGSMVSLKELIPLHPSRFVPMPQPRFIFRMLCAIKGSACSCS